MGVASEEKNGSSSLENRPFDCEVGRAGGGASFTADLMKMSSVLTTNQVTTCRVDQGNGDQFS